MTIIFNFITYFFSCVNYHQEETRKAMQEVKVNLTTQLKVTKQMVEDASLVAQATTRFLSYVLSFFGPFYLSHQCIFFIMFQFSLTIVNYLSYKNRQKNKLAFNGDETQKTINFGCELSFIMSFLFAERLHCCYIYFHSTSRAQLL